MYCDESGYSCSFSNNNLLFASFLDQNCDAVLNYNFNRCSKIASRKCCWQQWNCTLHSCYSHTSLLSTFKCGTKTTKRLISDIQGKKTHTFSLSMLIPFYQKLCQDHQRFKQTNQLRKDFRLPELKCRVLQIEDDSVTH